MRIKSEWVASRVSQLYRWNVIVPLLLIGIGLLTTLSIVVSLSVIDSPRDAGGAGKLDSGNTHPLAQTQTQSQTDDKIIEDTDTNVNTHTPPVTTTTNKPETPPPPPPSQQDAGEGDGDIWRERQQQVRAAIKHAWDGYRQFAWGFDELKPVTKGNINWLGGLGATIIDSLDTLWIAGLSSEFNDARRWVEESLRFDKDVHISTFECTIRYLGGLLGAYELSRDQLFLDKAVDLADRLIWAFNSSTGLPYTSVNLFTHDLQLPQWSGGAAILSEVGTLQMEFGYLSQHTGDPVYGQKVQRAIDALDAIPKPGNGLYPVYVDVHGGGWRSSHVSLGALGDSFFEYLLKYWVLHGKDLPQHRRMYDEQMQAVFEKLLAKSSPSGLTYIAEAEGEIQVPKWDHLACFSGGMLALGAQTAPDGSIAKERADEYMNVAAEITRTCNELYVRQATGIGPEMVQFINAGNDEDFVAGAPFYILRPETVESFFYMWRFTHDVKYREWGWKAFEAIERHCRTDCGYSGIRDVNSQSPVQDDQQQSFFLAETLKYLYLLFSPDDVIPLDKYVFNTEAHPLGVFNM